MSTSNSTTSSSPNGKFIFKCDQHAASISEKLLKFYEEKDFFDTVLVAGNDCIKIPAHKIVLSALSEYFWEIFHGNPIPTSNSNEVKLKEIEAASLKFIVDFMYSGSIELNLEKIETLLRSAVFLKIKNLVNGCCDFLKKNLKISNCLNWLLLAKELRLSELQEKSLNIVYTHFEEVTKQSAFLQLNKIELKDLLFKDNPYGNFEEQVFLSLVTWIEYDEVNRQDLLFELLSMVRYQYLTPKFIVENSSSVSKTVENCNLILHWLKYHLSPESRTIEHQNLTFSSKPEPRKEVGEYTVFSLNIRKEAEILSYNEANRSWSLLDRSRPLLTKADQHSNIVIDEKLFLVGGIDGNGIATNCLERVDLKTFELTHLPPMPTGRYRGQLANLKGHLCVYGGFENSNRDKFIQSMEIFNFSTSKWSTLEPLFKPEKQSKMTVHNGILCIFDFHYSSVQYYDVSSNQWTSKKIPIDDTLRNFEISAFGKFVYCFYVRDKALFSIDIVQIVKRFDLSNDSWCEKEEISLCDGLLVEKITVIGHNILLQKYQDRRVLEYNLDTNKFTYLEYLPYNYNNCIFRLKS